jgi:hypothetical protein
MLQSFDFHDTILFYHHLYMQVTKISKLVKLLQTGSRMDKKQYLINRHQRP